MSIRRSVRRWVGLIGLSICRLIGRLRGGNRARLLLSIGGVALAICFMLIVTSVSFGLATQSTVHGSDVDYWMTPESASASTMPVSVGGPEFGDVHAANDRIQSISGVAHSSPVAVELTRLGHGDSETYVVLLGVIAGPDVRVAGLPAAALAPGDPFYANGSYNGTWTGDLVLSEAAGDALNASTTGTTLTPHTDSDKQFTVVNVSAGTLSSGSGAVPVGLVHLSELQALTTNPPSDTADQILVSTNSRGVRSALADIYPESNVAASSGFSVGSLTSSELALAIALSAFLVALIVGVLFAGTTLGLDVAADRTQFATLAAVGVSTTGRGVVVATQTLVLVGIGGVIGVVMGVAGTVVANSILQSYVGTTAAVFHPALVPYGLGVALLIGVLAIPYLVWLTNRTNVLDQLKS